MIQDYNILYDGEFYFVYSDKFPETNAIYDWNNAERQEYDGVVLVKGPSGKMVDIDPDRNYSAYVQSRSIVAKEIKYDQIEPSVYNANSIIVDSEGNYISFDEWVFGDTDITFDGGTAYFSPMTQNVNDRLVAYRNEIQEALVIHSPVNLNNGNVFPSLNTKMNLKVNTPVVKAVNSITRKEKKEGVVIKASR